MADTTHQKTGVGPCDKCGSDDDCRCGPCQCKWCRYDRGEATELERAMVASGLEARRLDEVKASAVRMAEKIRKERANG